MDDGAGRATQAAVPTLTRDEYVSATVFDAERERIFRGGWTFLAHTSTVPVGGRRTFDVAGEQVLVTRDRSGGWHAFANVCRHRGSRLCAPTDPVAEPESCRAASIQCPYHAWTYALDGSLLSTPRVERHELDRDLHPLWSYRIGVWNGLVFVSLAADPPSLADWLHDQAPDLEQFADLPMGDMVCLRRTTSEVGANWKILVENYLECLHCAVVHPELVEIVPLYRTGLVLDPDRDDDGVEIVDGGNSFAAGGHADLPLVPGIDEDDAHLYRGAAVFPNLFVDVTGTGVVLTALRPVAADRTVVVGEYLFASDATTAAADQLAAVIDFNELVGAQDNEICEAVQHGVNSSAFTVGVLTEKDALVSDFDAQYRSAMGSVLPT